MGFSAGRVAHETLSSNSGAAKKDLHPKLNKIQF
jgi:hypothetical protein